MPTDTFYPPSERFKLALALNQILASPAFNQWMTGVPLEIGSFLHSPEGKPRASIFTVSHLSDNERMFFISMVLNEIVGWMRTQTGTPSLRAILYIDEVFGYMPPVKEPPSKKPLITLLKQARAFGIGVVLATQNPVDLDYKGLSNIGTWFIGRLQTQRDKDRVLEGLERLENASGYDRQFLDKAITGLKKREFLLNNVHENSPSIFTSRWAMSYLRGPLTREQISSIMEERKEEPHVEGAKPAMERTRGVKGYTSPVKPAISPDVNEFFVDLPVTSDSWAYKPFIVGSGDIYYSNPKLGIEERIACLLGAEAPHNTLEPNWENALELDEGDLCREGNEQLKFLELPAAMANPSNYKKWEKAFQRWIRQNKPLVIFKNQSLKLASSPGEGRGDFEIRVEEALREKRDMEIEKLRKKYDSKMATLQKQLMAAEQAIARESEQAKNRNIDTVISFGSAIASALLGRKSLTATSTYRMGSALSKAGKLKKEKMDIARAEEKTQFIQEQLAALEASLNEEIEKLTESMEKYREATQEHLVRPQSTNINIKVFGLAWVPVEIEN
jgi:hypothetical protein